MDGIWFICIIFSDFLSKTAQPISSQKHSLYFVSKFKQPVVQLRFSVFP